MFGSALPNLRLGVVKCMLPQTKIWEGGTKDEKQKMTSGFSTDFSMVRPKSSTHALEECFLRNPHLIFSSSCPNLRWEIINLLPKESNTTWGASSQ